MARFAFQLLALIQGAWSSDVCSADVCSRDGGTRLPFAKEMALIQGARRLNSMQIKLLAADAGTDVCSSDNRLRMKLNRQLANNLGGMGPNFEDSPIIKYKNVFPKSDRKIFLQIVNKSEYIPSNNSRNGAFHKLSQINVKSGTSVDLTFRFFERVNGKYEPAVAPDFAFSVLDLDHGSFQGAKEIVRVSGAAYSNVTDDTELRRIEENAYEASEEGTIADNPRNPFALTDHQKRRSVSFTFINVKEFQVTLEVTSPVPDKDTGRNFLFTGATNVICPKIPSCADFSCPPGYANVGDGEYVPGDDAETCCEPKASCITHTCAAGKVLKSNPENLTCSSATCDCTDDSLCCDDESVLCERTLDLTSSVENNLDGQGPDASVNERIRFVNVMPSQEPAVDLVVRALSPYLANNASQNGPSGLFGNINVKSGTAVQLEFTFVRTGTESVVEVHDFYFSFYDLDTGKEGVATEGVTVLGWSSYELSETTQIISEDFGAKEINFYASQWGKESDNPSTITGLTPEQLDKTVAFHFPRTSSFQARFSASEPKEGATGGRNIYFAGGSPFKCST